jgi:hypothetical protein
MHATSSRPSARIQKYITPNHSLCDGEIGLDGRDEVATKLSHVRVVLVPHLKYHLPLELGLLLGRELPPVGESAFSVYRLLFDLSVGLLGFRFLFLRRPSALRRAFRAKHERIRQ